MNAMNVEVQSANRAQIRLLLAPEQLKPREC